jgi:hypothetical protein
MPIHNINMDKVAAGITDGFDITLEIAEIGREYTWGY